jgi:hypothetical protein
MLTLHTGCGDIIVMAAGVVHRRAPLVGSCLQDQRADEARLRRDSRCNAAVTCTRHDVEATDL